MLTGVNVEQSSRKRERPSTRPGRGRIACGGDQTVTLEDWLAVLASPVVVLMLTNLKKTT